LILIGSTSTHQQLEPGDRLVLYTDGLTEAMNSAEQEFGEPRLVELGNRNVTMNAAELLKTIMNDVSSFSGGSFQDDFTLVVVCLVVNQSRVNETGRLLKFSAIV
jgi:serine phosphatase RsbU (regulator of sigma subunit)